MPEEPIAKKYPVCPHCGHVDRDWWDVSPPRDVDEDSEWEAECGTCEKLYIVKVDRRITFGTHAPTTPSWVCDECGEHVLDSDEHKCWRTGLVIKRPEVKP